MPKKQEFKVLPPFKGPTDETLREFWRRNGGSFHGPNVETGTMPEAKLLPMMRKLIADAWVHKTLNNQQAATIKRLRKQVAAMREANRMAAVGRSMLG